ncbi:hypothetical protein B0H21DRAFT_823494 [Amylocystis lapponica]|nr:hypothetical protein B0H21DRAFT_823494 [Amylocystis lapponica]
MALSNIHDSPVKFATRQSFHSGLLPKVDVIRKELLTAMSGKFVNMKFDKFMDTFVRNELGPVKPPPPKKWKGKFNAITNGIQEAGLQTKFIKIIDKLKLLEPGYKMISSPDRADQTDSFGQKADGGVYASSEAPKDNRTCWATKALSVEFKKASTKDDPFDDKGGQGGSSFEAESIQRRKNRGQIIHYASQVFLHQHRCFLFSIIVLGTSARILRWDRSGTIVTEKFDYRNRPEMICEFLWSFARLSPKAQGYDTTAVRVEKGSPETPWSYIGDYFRSSLAPGWIRYKVTVVDEGESGDDGQDTGDSDNGATGDTVADDPGAGEGSKASSTSSGKKVFQFLICKPHFSVPGVLGRGTRGYVAIDVATQKFVFLKDAWRVRLPGIQREGDVLRFLNAKGVQNIPTVLCHGDVDCQCTLSQGYSEWLDDDDLNPLKEHCHYRLAELEIGQKLETFQAGNVLLKIMWDCLTAHEDAYVKARILHRDISEGNILIFYRRRPGGYIEPCGLLNDWELSKKIPNIDARQDDASSGRQPDRTGTWLFLSALSLNDKWKQILLQDDLESFFHVLLYMAIRFIPSNCDDVGGFIDRFFEAATVRKDGEYTCGPDKMSAMQIGRIRVNSALVPLKFMESNVDYPINQLINTLLQWFSAYYREDEDRVMSQANNAGPSSQPPPATSSAYTTQPMPFQYLPPMPVSEPTLDSLMSTPQVVPSRDAELAANLSSHKNIRALFRRLGERRDWPPSDKTDDQRPKLNYSGSKRTSESVLDQDLDLPRPKRIKLSLPDPVSEGYVPNPSNGDGHGERCEKAGTFSVSSEPAKASDWQRHQ